VGTTTDGGNVIRVDTGVVSGSAVSPWYDPMLAKVISFAPTRDEAARSLAYALARSHLHGITTNRDLLVRILRHPEFLSGEIDTGFLVRHDPADLGAPLASPDAEKLHAIAATLAGQALRRDEARSGGVLGGLPSGYRNNPSEPQHESFEGSTGVLEVAYRFDRTGRCVEVECHSVGEGGDGGADDSVGTAGGVEVIAALSTKVTLVRSGILSSYDVSIIDDVTYVDGPDGASALTRVARFPLPGSQLTPGSLIAPLPGTVVRVQVKTGDHVEAGQTLVAIEAMKMEHEIRTSHSGTVSEVAVAAGDQVESGRLLVVVQAADDAPGDTATAAKVD
jgi:propionyl-CoA carboxylase alpha chain